MIDVYRKFTIGTHATENDEPLGIVKRPTPEVEGGGDSN